MNKIEIEEKNLLAAYKDADTGQKKFMETLFGKKTFTKSGKIIDRITSWEDVANELSIDPVKSLPYPTPTNKEEEAINAVFILSKVRQVLNEGWVPDWSDGNQAKYFAWFEFKSGVGFSCNGFDYRGTVTGVGSRLAFKTADLAKYAGKQFEKYYIEFFTV